MFEVSTIRDGNHIIYYKTTFIARKTFQKCFENKPNITKSEKKLILSSSVCFIWNKLSLGEKVLNCQDFIPQNKISHTSMQTYNLSIVKLFPLEGISTTFALVSKNFA